ncbi:MAG: ABC transporter permease [Armatimonadaceae bacterium]
MPERMRTVLSAMGQPLAALLLAFLLGAVLIAVVTRNPAAPFSAYGALFAGAFGDPLAWSNTLRQATPLLFTGTAVAVALAAGLFNIGAEGQMAVGALAAATVGFVLKESVPPVLLLPLSLLAGAGAGALWALPPVLLKVYRGAHEVITAILLNYIAQNVTRFLASGPLKDPSGEAPLTPEVGATLPRLLPQYDVTTGLFLGIAAVLWVAAVLRFAVWGLRVRAVGTSPDAAEALGISVARKQIEAFALSGAMAGWAGAVVILGEAPFRRFAADFYGIGYGFDGLAVALLAAGASGVVSARTLGFLFPAALLFGALAAGAEAMDFNANIPKQIVQVVQAVLIALVAGRLLIRLRFKPQNKPLTDPQNAPGKEP